MNEINDELLTYIRRLEELRQESNSKLNTLREEKIKRDKVYQMQKLISDTSHAFSEEREHFLKLWRDNDLLKIEKSKQERKLLEYSNMCNPDGNN